MTRVAEFGRPARGKADTKALVPGEFLLTGEDFNQIASMLHADAGIHLPESKATLVYSRLAKRVRALGLESFREYCALVATADGVGERQKMLAALTTNVTNFFREPHHFEHLKTHVLPPLVSAAKRGGRVRFWSAGCSSGQEPYSIALTIFSLMPDADAHDVKVLATDIDSYMVARAREGTYSESAVSHVPADLRNRYFTSSRDSGERVWTVADRVRKLVVCRELNLNGPWPMQGPFQAIFCRNVVIYFDEAAQQRIWSRFVPLLSAEGWLYVGHSERVCGSAAAVLVSEGITSYRLRRAAP